MSNQPMQLVQAVDRYWQTIRYLRGGQIVSRLNLRTREAARLMNPKRTRQRYDRRAARAELTLHEDPWGLHGAPPNAAALIAADELLAARQEASDLSRGSFRALNVRGDLGLPLDWLAPGPSQLWRYHLHYFDYLPSLLIAGASPDIPSLLQDWVSRVPMAEAATRDAWHPYVVSVRTVNWMLTIAASPPDIEWPVRVLDSLKAQVVFVSRNLEMDVGGNHLLKNLKALAIAGCFWRGSFAASWRGRFVQAFIDEVAGQLRSDGGHYEQSPMYHGQVLGDAIELALVMRLRDGNSSPALLELLDRMDAFMTRVCHPDGHFAQFGDTAAGVVPRPAALRAALAVVHGSDPGPQLAPRHALLAAALLGGTVGRSTTAAREPAQSLPARAPVWDPAASGFESLITEDRRGFLIADAGAVCPDDLPAHAHSDTFGFEISVDGCRIVVDSGVSEYAAGPWRDYYRSTRAHNTIMVDNAEQSECWGSFRVARRAVVVDGRYLTRRNVRGFSAAHTGFERLRSPVKHTRRFLVVAGRFWLIVDDLSGPGTHNWSSFLHLHPDAELTADGDSSLVAERATAALRIAWFGTDPPRCIRGQRDPLQGWYAPAFGCAFPSPTLVCAGAGGLPRRLGWILIPSPSAGLPLRIDDSHEEQLRVQIGMDQYNLALDRTDTLEAESPPA